jgi:hypothetical protein
VLMSDGDVTTVDADAIRKSAAEMGDVLE